MVVEPTPATLCEAIIELLDDDELRQTMGGAGREKVHREYAWERVLETVREAYRTAFALPSVGGSASWNWTVRRSTRLFLASAIRIEPSGATARPPGSFRLKLRASPAMVWIIPVARSIERIRLFPESDI